MDEIRTTPFIESDPGNPRPQAQDLGYLYFRRLIGPDRINALRLKALEKAEELGWLHPDTPMEEGIARAGIRLGEYDALDWIAFQTRMIPLLEFVSLGEDPALLTILVRLFGAAVTPKRGDICRVMSPGTPELATVPHQDRFYVTGSDNLWTAWIPLGECPRELGGLALLPGSHVHGLLPHHGIGSGRQGVDVDEEEWATADYGTGDVLLFNCFTIHRALPNRTLNRLRFSADYRYSPRDSSRSQVGSVHRPRTMASDMRATRDISLTS